MSRVLVLDDDRPLARSLGINLRAHGYEVSLAHDGRTALTEVTRVHPAVVVLDLGSPDMDGIDVLGGIRCRSAVPVIVWGPGNDQQTQYLRVQRISYSAASSVTNCAHRCRC